MNMVVCSICGDEITKRSSLSVGNGKRACRKHQETQEQAPVVQKLRREAEIKRAEDLKGRRWGRKEPLGGETFDIRPKCFGCKTLGLRQDVFGLTMLKLSEKYQLKHGRSANPFNVEETKEMYAEMKGLSCLFVVPYDKKLRGLDFNTRQAGEIMGVIMLCPNCCKFNGLDPLKERQKDITFDDLVRESVRYEATLRPVLQAAAAQELLVEELLAEIQEGLHDPNQKPQADRTDP